MSLRILRVTGTSLDATTSLVADWNPEPPAGNRSQPYSWAFQATVGRISPRKWFSFGSIGAIVIAKAWQTSPDGPVTMTSRSPTAGELAELSPPANVPTSPPGTALNQPLESRTVNATSWSAPLLLSPEHALTLEQPGDGVAAPATNTVELMFIDIGSEEALVYVNTIFGACCADAGGDAFVRTVTEGESIAAFAGTQYILANASDPSMVLVLPAVASVVEGTTLVVTRIGGGIPQILPAPGETINGDATALVEINDIGQVTLVLRGGQWLSSDSPLTASITVSNAVAGATVAVPVITGTTRVDVDFTANGILQLPNLADVAVGTEYLFVRTTDGASQPVRAQIIPQVGERINGVANLAAYLAQPGSSVRVMRARSPVGPATPTWDVVSDRQSIAAQTLALAASTVLDTGVPSPKLIRATLATFQTITLPPSTTPIGTHYKITALGAAGLSVADGGSLIVGGGSLLTAASIRLAQYDTADFTFDGTNWHMIYSATNVQAVTAAANVVLAEGWTGLRIYRCTQVAAQSLDLPAPGLCKVGMELQVVGTGAGGLTINGGGANIINGVAPAASTGLAQWNAARFIYDGTNWQRT